MTFPRLLTVAVMLACLIPAASAAAQDFGGAPAAPLPEDASGGGIVAPAPDPAAGVVAEAAAEDSPEAAQTPTTPEGEKQPPDEEDGEEQPPDEEDGTPPPDDDQGGAGGGTGGGSLPRTGLEVAALSAIGLGLLLAGGALWPTSSWPPPRDRRSRSLQRR